MTAITYVSQKDMKRRTGFGKALGYAFPKKNEILLRKGLTEEKKKEVLAHEEDHIEKGEEGPFLDFIADIFGASKQASAARDATRAQEQASKESIAFQRESRDIARRDAAPYREAGYTALNSLMSLTGMAPPRSSRRALSAPESPGEGGSQFQADPGYNFRFNEGMRAVERGASSKGGLLSGGFARRAIRYGQNYASNEYQNVYNRIANIAGLGTVASANSGNAALIAGQGMSSAALYGGAARASGYTAQGNIWGDAIRSAGDFAQDIFRRRTTTGNDYFNSPAFRAGVT